MSNVTEGNYKLSFTETKILREKSVVILIFVSDLLTSSQPHSL